MLAAALVAFAVSLVVQPLVIALLTRGRVLDMPTERSNHTTPTPRAGGIAVMVAITVGALVGGGSLLITLMAGVLIAAGIGLLEDLRGIGVGPRLMLTSLAAATLVAPLIREASDIAIIPLVIVGVPWVLSVVNAFNFMDGINGISAATAVVAGIAYALLGYRVESEVASILGWIMTGAALGFLPYNVPRARVFLGDVGSYGLGAALATVSMVLVIEGVPLEAAVAPLAIYLADTATTILWRLRHGEPWRLPHKRHVYQRLVALGLPHTLVSAAVAAATAICAALGAVSLFADSAARIAADAAILLVLAVYLSSPHLLSPKARVS